MTDEFDNEVKPASDAASSLFRRKYPWAMLVVVILFVVIPFISWYGTWFGRPLSNSQISEYLDDSVKYRHVQQALEQIVDRIGKHDPAAKQWYAKVAALSSHPAPEVRKTAAWAMQYDPTSEEFHSALRAMGRPGPWGPSSGSFIPSLIQRCIWTSGNSFNAQTL